jgi:hypothetical protein
MTNGKQKGKRGERDFAEFLESTLGDPLKVKDIAERFYADVHGQGADNVTISGLAIEVKRQEILLVDKWWQQTCIQADKLNLVPVLVYRQNRKKWTACIPAYLLSLELTGYITLSERVFQQWLLGWVKK